VLTLDGTVDFYEGLVADKQGGPLWATFDALLGILKRHRRVCFAGALALGAHGVERSTRDIDLLVHPDERERLVRALDQDFVLQEDLDTLLVFADRETQTEVDLLVAFDPISLAACSEPVPARLRGHRVRVVGAESLAAMKVVAAVDSPAIEPKQRGDLDALVRAGKVDVNAVSRLLQDDAGVEYARYFMGVVRHVRAHPVRIAPKRKL